MLGWLYRRMIRSMEKRYSYDASYLHEMAQAAPAAFRRFARMQMARRWRGPVQTDAWYAASVGGALHEDCGPCVQIATDMAIGDGADPAVLRALLSGTKAPADARLAFDFARALLAADPACDTLREQVEARWGKAGVISLAMTAMTARNFPVLKRALGHAKACRRVRVGRDDVAVTPRPMAA
jgi:hypothetical protein